MPRRRWRVVAKTWWCPDCNVPLLHRRCSRCGAEGFELHLTEPGDARPMLPHDMQILKQAIEEDLGSPKPFHLLFEDKFVLVNKAIFIDDMREVVVDGSVAGLLYFDPFKQKWRFRLKKAGALKLLSHNAVECFEAPTSKVKAGEVYPKSGFERGRQILITHRGEPIALGVATSRGVKVFRKVDGLVAKTSEKKVSLQEVLQANEWILYRLVSKARAFLYVTAQKVGKPVVVGLSGGKDSAVTLDLAVQELGDPLVVFNDTGLELPETVETVQKTVEQYGLNLLVADAGEAFWENLPIFGPPGRDYRWCCKHCKLIPYAKLVKEHWPNGILSLVGQRAFESLERARSGKIWRNAWLPSVLSATPIQEWCSLAIWLYTFKNNLVVNPLYNMGFERIGCYMCPASKLAELKVVAERHPGLWGRWVEFLEKWRQKIGAPREWVTLGLWRWLTDASGKLFLAKKARVKPPPWRDVYNSWMPLPLQHYKLEEASAEVKLSTSLNMELLAEHSVILGNLVESSERFFSIKGSSATYHIYRDGLLKVTDAEDPIEEISDLIKLVLRVQLCTRCLSCALWCPQKAITITDTIHVNKQKCQSCRVCLDTCPLCDQLAEKLYLAYLCNNQLAWRRPKRMERAKRTKLLARL